MSPNAYREWMKIITGHYGSLDAFEDAPTIRNVLRMVTDEQDELVRIRAMLTNDEQRKEWDSVMWEDVADITSYRKDLMAWLEKRGLEP
ncbi:hypothetical protein J2J97_32090 (plasmid) [Rhizobium bangladeshense]|uniref:hypothetical protein n=1 Tax=Rhizobium bangladeshense TaxID=1138189 RepID=UPI001A9904A1|nr:hypothetical protein [Rhizobium bangladeshense]QSY98547.1 hypothetical protein J2J97_32090 [Rhizobium bangladeshense]